MKLWPATDSSGKVRQWLFWCPGCEAYHAFDGRWTFDGNLERPTFSPSLLSDWGDGRKCHLFLRAGRLEFLADSTHALAGQTVDLPDDPEGHA